MEGAPGAGGAVCPECGAVVQFPAASGDVVIDVEARPVGGDAGRSGDHPTTDNDATAGGDGYAEVEVEVEEKRGPGYYRRVVRGPGGAYRFEMMRGAQGGQGCFTCGCLVVALALFLMMRGCASLF